MSYSQGIADIYQQMLGRAPDANDIAQWNAYLQNGASFDQMRAEVAKAPEYQQLATNNLRTQVSDLYQQHLGRAPDEAGLTNWVNALQSGQSTLDQVRQGITHTPEWQQAHPNEAPPTTPFPTTPSQGPLAANPAGTSAAIQNVNNMMNSPSLPAGTEFTPALLQNNASQEQNPTQFNVSPQSSLPASGPAQAATQQAGAVDPLSANMMQAATTGAANAPQATAATNQNLTAGATAQAAQAEVDPRATVRQQLQELYNDPNQFWADGAKRSANEAMAQRGLGASTMAGEAITQRVMESALPIAAADAATYAQYGLANLNNRQQAALQNAQAAAGLQLQNLNNEQQTNLTNLQARMSVLLSDQSAENAARQFNATSQNQTDQFMAQLEAQAAQFNAAQVNAMAQFNAGQTNAWDLARAQEVQAREFFNSQMSAQIEAANIQWRRSINTANTAAVNAANQINVQNRLSMSTWALDKVWQEMRDEAHWGFTSSENDKTRAQNVFLMSLQNSFYKEAMDDAQKAEFARLGGRFFMNAVASLGT